MIHNPHNDRRLFKAKRCRAADCRVRVRNVYSIAIAPGETVWVHLCGEHHAFERKYGSQALALKPARPNGRPLAVQTVTEPA